MTADRPASRTVRVTLAAVPTDVLVWLCEQTDRVSLSVGVIADAVAPAGSVDARASVARAVGLLLDAGYVDGERIDGSPLFRASAAGRYAVAAALAIGDHAAPGGTP